MFTVDGKLVTRDELSQNDEKHIAAFDERSGT